MSIENSLAERSNHSCELCGSTENPSVYVVSPKTDLTMDTAAFLCQNCQSQIEGNATIDANHWRCLNDSMWSQEPPVQVLAWRMLTKLKPEGWPVDLLDMLYLDDETLAWAKAGLEAENAPKPTDSNGAELQSGDSVVLIKDLNVKGAGFTAKRGTAVRNISLVADDPEHILGKVNGQSIYILTKYVKK
ncbi:PhnA domain-containing protein [Roseivirga pacifica]|uniref:PhnA domain-containing protein n=1 Tax=Roseivirga pacifica TaxID=1267423 RepID=UPI003BAE69D0